MDPPGLRFGSFLAPKIAETCLEIPLGAPKSRSKDLFFGPGGLQERSKRPPRGLQAAKTAPRALQEAGGSILEPIWEPCWSDFGAMLQQFRSYFGDYKDVGRCMHGRRQMITGRRQMIAGRRQMITTVLSGSTT